MTVCTAFALQGASQAQAKTWIMEEQVDTVGAAEELHLDATKGIGPARALADHISTDLGLKFVEHVVIATSGKDSVEVKMYARPLAGVFRWMARFVDRRHCEAREQYTPDGERFHSHPMWSDWAVREYGAPRHKCTREISLSSPMIPRDIPLRGTYVTRDFIPQHT